ncbi:MAG: hypothetical protein JRF41_13060 [Deltaproteobacteria bacterium]|nr:hypothetical protein [Deltaproteobacteria bacterium]
MRLWLDQPFSALAPDIYRQKFGDGAKEIEIECPMCGKKHQAVLHEEEEK